jgi:hypothetical protein
MCNERKFRGDIAAERQKQTLDACRKLRVEATYRCDAPWLGENAVLVEATRNTARYKQGEFLVITLR